MSNADRLAGYLADFKKENKNSVSISIGGGDDESETANLLGWASSGFDKLKNKVSKVQENIPLPNPLKRNGYLDTACIITGAERKFISSITTKNTNAIIFAPKNWPSQRDVPRSKYFVMLYD